MKILKLLLCALLLFSYSGCTQKEDASSDAEEVKITIVIEDALTDTELFSGTIDAEGDDLTLEDVLNANADVLQLVSEKKAYGMQINGLMGLETEDWSKGPWWLFTSENNAGCVEAGYCLGASDVKVADGDIFVFSFSTGY